MQNDYIIPSRARDITAAEHAAFCRYCHKTRGTERLFALYLLIRYTGLRISEALSLTIADVYDGFEIRAVVPAKTAKQRGVKRSRNLSLASPKDSLRKELKRLVWPRRQTPTAPLFATATGKAWERTSCSHALTDTCQRARITVFSWHDLRHAYGSEVFDRTGNIAVVQAALGHASPASVKHYLHPRVDVLHEVNVAIR